MRLKSSKRGFVGPVACVMALGFLGFSIVYPQIGSAYAAEDKNPVEGSGDGTIQVEVKEVFGPGITDTEGSGSGQISVDVETLGESGNATDTKSETITVKVEEFLQITIPNANEGATADVAMEADPVSGGVTTRNSANFTVAGNNRNGFGVFVYAALDPSLPLNAMDTSTKVSPITGSDVALDDFGTNSWGYNVTKADATESTINAYNPLAISPNMAYSIDHPSSGEELKLNCGAKVDTTIPAGTYSTGVVISAVAPATNWQP